MLREIQSPALGIIFDHTFSSLFLLMSQCSVCGMALLSPAQAADKPWASSKRLLDSWKRWQKSHSCRHLLRKADSCVLQEFQSAFPIPIFVAFRIGWIHSQNHCLYGDSCCQPVLPKLFSSCSLQRKFSWKKSDFWKRTPVFWNFSLNEISLPTLLSKIAPLQHFLVNNIIHMRANTMRLKQSASTLPKQNVK